MINRSKSHEIFQRAQQLMPGGVNSPARAFGGVGGEPIVFERARTARISSMSMAIATSTTSARGDR